MSTATIPTSDGRKLTANIDPVPGFELPWCIVAAPGTDSEYVLIACGTFAEAVRKRDGLAPNADIMKRRPDGSLTTEF